VSASFSYIPSLEVTNPEVKQGLVSNEFGVYGKWNIAVLEQMGQ
jgi:hypothetical protein